MQRDAGLTRLLGSDLDESIDPPRRQREQDLRAPAGRGRHFSLGRLCAADVGENSPSAGLDVELEDPSLSGDIDHVEVDLDRLSVHVRPLQDHPSLTGGGRDRHPEPGGSEEQVAEARFTGAALRGGEGPALEEALEQHIRRGVLPESLTGHCGVEKVVGLLRLSPQVLEARRRVEEATRAEESVGPPRHRGRGGLVILRRSAGRRRSREVKE
ncbi:MAG: hypothetical protein R3B09_06045 [Nannocystaceae bacterium]